MNTFSKYLNSKIPAAITLIVVSLIILTLYVGFIDDVNEKFRHALNAIVPALMLGLIFTALSKLNLILNVHDISKEAQKNLGDLGSLISGNTNHGLSGTVSHFDGISEVSRLRKGDKVLWLDTRIASTNLVTSLSKALDAGVEIRAVVMHPESEISKYRYLEIESATDIESYTESLVRQKKQFDRLVSNDDYKIEVAYTKEIISAPVLIVKSGSHEYAYSGFFLYDRAIEFPYVYWKSGETGLIDCLEKYFERKWSNAVSQEEPDELIRGAEERRMKLNDQA